MSDIEFLSIKESEGKLRQDDGVQDGTTGDVATLTANTGKDMYLAKAKIQAFPDDTIGGGNVEVVLKLNGTEVERWGERLFNGNSAASYEFVNIGQKVAAGEIIKIEVVTATSIVRVHGSIICFEEDTGISPQIPAI